MKLFTTFAGAQRAAKGRPILRLLDDPEHAFLVLPNMATQIMAVDPDKGTVDGRVSFMTLSATRNVDRELKEQALRLKRFVDASLELLAAFAPGIGVIAGEGRGTVPLDDRLALAKRLDEAIGELRFLMLDYPEPAPPHDGCPDCESTGTCEEHPFPEHR